MEQNHVHSTIDRGRYRIERLRSTGVVKLTASGTGIEGMLEAALVGFLAVLQPVLEGINGDGSCSTTIRAEAPTVALLFTGLANAMLDQLESTDLAPASVRFDGLVRSERGLIGWARLLFTAAGSVPSRVLTVLAATEIVGEGGERSLEITLVPA